MQNQNELVRSLEVIGSVKKTFTPDLVNIAVTVAVVREVLQDAKIEHTKQQYLLKNVFADLNIENKNIQTFARNDAKNTEWDDVKRVNVPAGYKSSQVTNLKVSLEVGSKVFDEISKLKKDISVSIVSFEFSGIDELKEKAYVEAIQNAHDQAKVRSKALNTTLGSVIFCSENIDGSRESGEMRAMGLGASKRMSDDDSNEMISTEINVAESSIKVRIKVVFELHANAISKTTAAQ